MAADAVRVTQHCNGAHAGSLFCRHNAKCLAKIRGRDNTQRNLQPRVSLPIHLHMPQYRELDMNGQKYALNIRYSALQQYRPAKAKGFRETQHVHSQHPFKMQILSRQCKPYATETDRERYLSASCGSMAQLCRTLPVA